MLGSGSLKPQSKLAPLWTLSQVKDALKPANNLNELADALLVGRTRAGDNKSFEVLVRRYQKLVYNVIFQMIRSHEAASDLTQDTFLKAYRALPSFDTQKKFKPWLLKIATNATLNSIRDTKGEQSLEELLEANPQAEPTADDDVAREVELRVSQTMLFDALGKLPIKQREAFILRYQQDLAYEDIAEITGLSLSSVKSLLFRARESLRKILTEEHVVSI